MIVYLPGSLNRDGTVTLMLDVFRNAVSCGLDIGICPKPLKVVLATDKFS